MGIAELLGGMADDDSNEPFKGDAEIEAEVIAGLRDAMEERHAFKPGDLVEWKPGLRNKRWPCVGQPSVVVGIMAEPILDHTVEAGSNYFREPLDLVIGYRHPSDGQFTEYHVDSRRFRPWKGAAS